VPSEHSRDKSCALAARQRRLDEGPEKLLRGEDFGVEHVEADGNAGDFVSPIGEPS